MNDILFNYLDDFCTVYLDDILIYSKDPIEHEKHVKLVFQRLREAGLQADINKCEFNVEKTRYLGFIIGTNGLSVDPEKITAIKNWNVPKNVKEVQSFLGFCNFYRRFIRNYGIIAKPLNQLTRKEKVFSFTDDCLHAFQTLQQKLINAPLLAHYDPNCRSQIQTDASDGVIAAVFSQLGKDNLFHPVAFFSKTMQAAELNYEIHDKELLAIIRSLQQWRAELQGSPHTIEILTDHKALEYFMSTKTLNSRQARWAEFLSEYNFVIKYHPGKSNAAADALSRRQQDVKPQLIKLTQLRERALLRRNQFEQKDSTTDVNFMGKFEEIDKILRLNRDHPSLEHLRILARNKSDDNFKLHDGLLIYKKDRLVVPDVDNVRTALVKEVHDQPSTAHPGAKKTLQLLSARYYWKGMNAFVTQFLNNCHVCKRSHINHDKSPGFLHCLPVPEFPWQHICMDFKEMPQDKNEFNMVVVFIDRLSKKAVSIPCKKTISSKDMAEIYFIHCFRHLGVPDSVVSDRGPQFISHFWGCLCKLLQVERKLSTSYHPETDGQTEIMNQYLDLRLRPFVNHFQDNWGSLLPLMDFAQLALHHESINISPYKLLFGREPRFTFDWKAPSRPESAREILSQNEAKMITRRMQEAWIWAKENMLKSQEKKMRDVNQHRREPNFDVGDKVWLSARNIPIDRPSRKLGHQNIGPYVIKRKVGYSYELDLPESLKQIHPVFHAKLLRKDPCNPVPGQELPDPEELHIIPGQKEFAVEKIRAVKLIRGRLKYRADWIGGEEDSNYYPASNFMYSPHLLKEFHTDHPYLPGPPANLPFWLKAYEDGIDNYDELEDDSAMNKRLRAVFFRGGG